MTPEIAKRLLDLTMEYQQALEREAFVQSHGPTVRGRGLEEIAADYAAAFNEGLRD